jgi:5-methylcytosine-specific restriction endonuclease McrA
MDAPREGVGRAATPEVRAQPGSPDNERGTYASASHADRRLLAEAWSRGHGCCEASGCVSLAHSIVHRVPRHKGGRDTVENMMLVCKKHEGERPV